MIRKLAFLSLTALAVLLAACAGQAGQQEITVDARAMQYEPPNIEVVAGRPVKLTFRNNDTVDHDFSITEFPMAMRGATQAPVAGHDMGHVAEEPDLHVAAMMSQSATLEFTPSAPGTYEFFCTVTGHRQAGMKGTLVVTAP